MLRSLAALVLTPDPDCWYRALEIPLEKAGGKEIIGFQALIFHPKPSANFNPIPHLTPKLILTLTSPPKFPALPQGPPAISLSPVRCPLLEGLLTVSRSCLSLWTFSHPAGSGWDSLSPGSTASPVCSTPCLVPPCFLARLSTDSKFPGRRV